MAEVVKLHKADQKIFSCYLIPLQIGWAGIEDVNGEWSMVNIRTIHFKPIMVFSGVPNY
jgi:hypothetical protein